MSFLSFLPSFAPHSFLPLFTFFLPLSTFFSSFLWFPLSPHSPCFFPHSAFLSLTPLSLDHSSTFSSFLLLLSIFLLFPLLPFFPTFPLCLSSDFSGTPELMKCMGLDVGCWSLAAFLTCSPLRWFGFWWCPCVMGCRLSLPHLPLLQPECGRVLYFPLPFFAPTPITNRH